MEIWFRRRWRSELLKMRLVQAPVFWDMQSLLELFVITLYGIPIGESNETIPTAILVQTGFVANSHSPHPRTIKTTTKTLAASNLHFAINTFCPKLNPSGFGIFPPLEWRIARHL